MKFKMLQTVEDSHKYVVEDKKTGEPHIEFHVAKFHPFNESGEPIVYDSDMIEGGERRAQKLIKLGYAEEV